jgi:cytochrome c
MDTLYMHALQGYQGEKGFMPPKGGRVDLSDDEIKAAVDYIIEQSR